MSTPTTDISTFGFKKFSASLSAHLQINPARPEGHQTRIVSILSPSANAPIVVTVNYTKDGAPTNLFDTTTLHRDGTWSRFVSLGESI